jgi:hypothetical protein
MKLTKQNLTAIIKEELDDDSNSKLVLVLTKLLSKLDNLDISIDYLSSAVTGADPLSIGLGQQTYGRAVGPMMPPQPLKEIIKEELHDVLGSLNESGWDWLPFQSQAGGGAAMRSGGRGRYWDPEELRQYLEYTKNWDVARDAMDQMTWQNIEKVEDMPYGAAEMLALGAGAEMAAGSKLASNLLAKIPWKRLPAALRKQYMYPGRDIAQRLRQPVDILGRNPFALTNKLIPKRTAPLAWAAAAEAGENESETDAEKRARLEAAGMMRAVPEPIVTGELEGPYWDDDDDLPEAIVTGGPLSEPAWNEK